jgi:hypothetical protein
MTKLLIRVDAELTDELMSAFPHLRAQPQRPQTMLTGDVVDQEELQGVLNLLSGLGIHVVEVMTIPERAGRSRRPGCEVHQLRDRLGVRTWWSSECTCAMESLMCKGTLLLRLDSVTVLRFPVCRQDRSWDSAAVAHGQSLLAGPGPDSGIVARSDRWCLGPPAPRRRLAPHRRRTGSSVCPRGPLPASQIWAAP